MMTSLFFKAKSKKKSGLTIFTNLYKLAVKNKGTQKEYSD